MGIPTSKNRHVVMQDFSLVVLDFFLVRLPAASVKKKRLAEPERAPVNQPVMCHITLKTILREVHPIKG
ncbi:MAG: hypothetical protein M0Q93_09450, partial [Terrimicrobiaceae bacterium]|nr:hypothetical protein [Terrimicrobiaceae bacterium]